VSYRLVSYVSAATLFAATVAFVAALMISVPASAEMNFELVEISNTTRCDATCLKVVSAQGEITEHSADEFLAFLEHKLGKQRLKGIVLLHSPGGNVVGAMKLGRVLRELGAAVVIARAGGSARMMGSKIRLAPGHCMSACVFVLMGGAKRIVPDPSEVGIHRMFRIEAGRDPAGGANYKRVYATDTIVEALRQYSDFMGVSPSLIDSAERVSPDTVHIVNATEMRRWRLGTSRF
jgi:hypothetical protein